MSHIFISYSRKDIDYAEEIVQALADLEINSWIDWKSIPKGEDWWERIQRGIEEADAFLFLISPDSIKSDACRAEIDHAVTNSKRILPILIREIGRRSVHPEISKRNWISCREEQDIFEKAIKETLETIHTDYAWLQSHTELQTKALEWERHKDASRLLQGKELREAEQQLANAGIYKDPQPTDLQRQYILLSQRREVNLRRSIVLGLTAGLIIMAILSLITWRQRNIAVAETNAKVTALNNEEKAKLTAEAASTLATSKEQEAIAALVNEENAKLTAQAASTLATTKEQEAIEKQQIAFSSSLASTSLLHQEDLHDLALLLSVEAYQRKQTYETKNSLLSVIQEPENLHWIMYSDTSPVQNLALSPNGKRMATGLRNGQIILWDTYTRRPVMPPIDAHTDFIERLVFHPNGKILASASRDHTIGLWDISTGKLIERLAKHIGAVTGLAFSPDGNTLASCGTDGYLIFWDVDPPVSNGEIIPIQDKVGFSALALTPSSEGIVAAGTINGKIYFWSFTEHTPIKEPLIGHTSKINDLDFSLDGSYLASAEEEDPSIILWDITNQKQIASLEGHDSSVQGLAFSPDGKTLVSGGADNRVIFWDMTKYAKIKETTKIHQKPVTSIVFSPDGKSIFSADSGNMIFQWSAVHDSGIDINSLGTSSWIRSLAVQPETGKLYAASTDGKTYLVQTINGKTELLPFVTIENGVTSLAISHNGKWLAAGGVYSEGVITIFDSATRKSIKNLTEPANSVTAVTFSNDDNLFASADFSSNIFLWSTKNWERIGQLRSNVSVNSIAFSPNSKLIASGQSNGSVLIWNLETHKKVFEKKKHDGAVYKVAFSPDGKYLVSAGSDHKIILWNIENKQAKEKVLTGHTDSIRDIVFSPDGILLASGSADGVIILWDAVSGQRIGHALKGHLFNAITSLVFSIDGKRLYSSGRDKRVVIWNIDPDYWKELACIKVGRNLTQSEWQQYFPDEPYQRTCPQWLIGK